MSPQIAPLALAGFLAIGGIDAWLAAVLINAVTSDDQIATATTSQTLKLQTSAQGTPAVKPIDAYSLIVSRPVFFKTRAPYVAPPPPPPPSTTAAPQPIPTDPGLVLGGVVMNGHVRKIYLFGKGEPQGTWVNEGETFKGWKVQSVERTSTKLQQQNRTVELHLYPPP